MRKIDWWDDPLIPAFSPWRRRKGSSVLAMANVGFVGEFSAFALLTPARAITWRAFSPEGAAWTVGMRICWDWLGVFIEV